MKNLDFIQSGRMPLTQELLDFMQATYKESIDSICALVGDNCIIKQASPGVNGWAIVGGELLPVIYANGTIANLTTTVENLTFYNGSAKPVKTSKRVILAPGATVGAMQIAEWAGFPVLADLKTVIPKAALQTVDFDTVIADDYSIKLHVVADFAREIISIDGLAEVTNYFGGGDGLFSANGYLFAETDANWGRYLTMPTTGWHYTIAHCTWPNTIIYLPARVRIETNGLRIKIDAQTPVQGIAATSCLVKVNLTGKM